MPALTSIMTIATNWCYALTIFWLSYLFSLYTKSCVLITIVLVRRPCHGKATNCVVVFSKILLLSYMSLLYEGGCLCKGASFVRLQTKDPLMGMDEHIPVIIIQL